MIKQGKEFRKWVGTTLLGTKKSTLTEEKAAAELLNSLGILYNVWPQAQTKPDGLKNIAVFDAANVKIVKMEQAQGGAGFDPNAGAGAQSGSSSQQGDVQDADFEEVK